MGSEEHVGLFGTRKLHGRSPGCLFHLPIADRAPLRHHERTVETGFGDSVRQPEQAAVHLEADEVDGRRPRLDFRYDIRPEVRQRRRHRMVRIQFVDHLRDIVDGVPDARVGVAFIQLVADEPEQQGWVIFILEDFVTDPRQLRGDGVGIIVVKAVTLGRHGQSKRNRDAMRVRRIQQLPGVLVVALRGPGPDRITAVSGKSLDIVPAHARAFYDVGFASTHQHVALRGVCYLDLKRRCGVTRLWGTGCHQ